MLVSFLLSERGNAAAYRAQYARFEAPSFLLILQFGSIVIWCQVDGVASARGSLGIQRSVAVVCMRNRAYICLLSRRARFTRTGSFVVSVPIWLKLLFVTVVCVHRCL